MDLVSIHLNHLVNVALWPSELCGVLHLDQDYEVQIVPHVVLGTDVFFKRHIFVVKFLRKYSSFYSEYNWADTHLSFQSAYEAGVLDHLFLVLLL